MFLLSADENDKSSVFFRIVRYQWVCFSITFCDESFGIDLFLCQIIQYGLYAFLGKPVVVGIFANVVGMRQYFNGNFRMVFLKIDHPIEFQVMIFPVHQSWWQR